MAATISMCDRLAVMAESINVETCPGELDSADLRLNYLSFVKTSLERDWTESGGAALMEERRDDLRRKSHWYYINLFEGMRRRKEGEAEAAAAFEVVSIRGRLH